MQSLVTNFTWRFIGAVAAPAYTRTGATLDDIDAIEPGGAIASWVKSTTVKNKADQFCLLTGKTTDGFAGRGYMRRQMATPFSYSVCTAVWGSSYFVIVHELGHNFGCNHDRAHINVVSAGVYGDPAPDGDGYWNYGQLWKNPPVSTGNSGTAGTIMSYADYPIPYFSNPNILVHVTGLLLGWSWDPDLGSHLTGLVESDPKAANNARVLTDNALAMSQLSDTITLPTIQPLPESRTYNVGDTIQLLTQTTGGELSFQWNKEGVAIAGGTFAVFSKTAELSDAGNYSLTVSNLAGSATSTVVKVTVNTPLPPAPVSTTSSSGGGGGGGGALNPWFIGTIGLLCLIRQLLGGNTRRPGNTAHK